MADHILWVAWGVGGLIAKAPREGREGGWAAGGAQRLSGGEARAPRSEVLCKL